jgi:hypothetical protein
VHYPPYVSYQIEEHGCIYNLFDSKCVEAWKHKILVKQKIKRNQVAPSKTVSLSDSN